MSLILYGMRGLEYFDLHICTLNLVDRWSHLSILGSLNEGSNILIVGNARPSLPAPVGNARLSLPTVPSYLCQQIVYFYDIYNDSSGVCSNHHGSM